MELTTEFDAGHNDLINDLTLNYYGNILLTASTDHTLKLFKLADSEWKLQETVKAHDSAIVKTSFAHPEFGCLFASASFDRTIKVWELDCDRVVERAKLAESRNNVLDVAFGPQYLGLKLASCSSDGILRIHEALDSMNPSAWTLIIALAKDSESLCLSWCTQKPHQKLVVGIGCEARIVISEPNWILGDTLKGHSGIVRDVAWAPNLGRTYDLIATACSDGHVRIFRLDESINLVADFTEHGSEVWKVEWNVTGTVLTSSGDDGVLRLWKCSFLKEWKMIGVVGAESSQISR